MSRIHATTNFRDSNGVDLGKKLITKDYLISVYPSIGQQIGIPPELWIWGQGDNGKLGNAVTTGNISTPVTTFAGETNWKQVSCGRFHTAAIKTDGTLWSWGQGTDGSLGNAVNADRSTPVTTFAGGTNWKQVSCGYRFTAAIKTDGTLWTWGYTNSGRLGNANASSTGGRSTPVTTFAGGTNWKQVSCGGRHGAAIKTDGTLWTWGRGDDGQLGNNAAGICSTPVTTFAGGTNWKQVSAGGSFTASLRAHTAAIKTDGTLWTWGSAGSGRLGNAVTTTSSLGIISTPITTFAGGNNWKQVSAGSIFGQHTAAIKTDGTLWTWGYGGAGRLGNNSGANCSTPVTTFAGGNNWKQVGAGDGYVVAIKTDGTLWTWGGGSNGRLGNAVTTNTFTPVTTFASGTNWKQVSCAVLHTAAIKSVDF